MTDIIAVNKADGNTVDDAQHAKAAYQRALSILQPVGSWKPLALTCSAVTGAGLDELWQQVRNHRRQLIDTGELVERREQQRIGWMWSMVDQFVLASLRDNTVLENLIRTTENQVRSQKLTALQGASALLEAWQPSNPGGVPESAPREQ